MWIKLHFASKDRSICSGSPATRRMENIPFLSLANRIAHFSHQMNEYIFMGNLPVTMSVLNNSDTFCPSTELIEK